MINLLEKFLNTLFLDFWHFCGGIIVIVLVFQYVANGLILIWRRLLRSVNIALRGWSPAHLDADGDWNPYEYEEENQEP